MPSPHPVADAFTALVAAARALPRSACPHGSILLQPQGIGAPLYGPLDSKGTTFAIEPTPATAHAIMAHTALWAPTLARFSTFVDALQAHPTLRHQAHRVEVQIFRSRQGYVNLNLDKFRAWSLTPRRLTVAQIAAVLRDAEHTRGSLRTQAMIDTRGPAIVGLSAGAPDTLRVLARLYAEDPTHTPPEVWAHAGTYDHKNGPHPDAGGGYAMPIDSPYWAITVTGFGFVGTIQAEDPKQAAALFAKAYAHKHQNRPQAQSQMLTGLPRDLDGRTLLVWAIPADTALVRQRRIP